MSPLSPAAKQAEEDHKNRLAEHRLDALSWAMQNYGHLQPWQQAVLAGTSGGKSVADTKLTAEEIKRAMKAIPRDTAAVHPRAIWSRPQSPYDWDVFPVVRGARGHEDMSFSNWARCLRDLLGGEVVPGVEGYTLMSMYDIDDLSQRMVTVYDIFGHGEGIRYGDGSIHEVRYHALRIHHRWREMMVTPPEGLGDCLPHLSRCVGYRIGYRKWARGEARVFSDLPPITSFEMPEDIHEQEIRLRYADVLMSSFRCQLWEPRQAMVLARPGVGFFARKSVPDERLSPLPSQVDGLVALWGDVYEHAKGYRATHAYPYAIIEDEGIAELYGVPCITREQAEVML